MRKPKDWDQPCPNPDSSHYRLMNRSNISAISTYMSQNGKRRIFRCNKCENSFAETRDTVFFDLRTPEDKVMMALKMLLVKVGLTDIGFVLDVTEETVLMWLSRAAQKAHEINTYLLRELPVSEVQLDEMWSFIKRKHTAQQADADGESSDLNEDGRQWVWISFAPDFARPHMSSRLPLSEQGPSPSGLIQPKWQHRTPGMAAGLTDHVWTFWELLTAKFEPFHNQSSSG